MLDHHPQIAFEHEFPAAVGLVTDAGELPALDAYVEWLGSLRGFQYLIDRTLGYRELVDDFLRQKKLSSGDKKFIGATVHHHFDRLLFIWPDARFIHLIRDPRDVAPSVLQKGWAGNLYHAAEWWPQAEQCWDSLVSRLPAERFVETRYEALVTNPEQELTRICQFIGVDFDPSMLDYQRDARQYPKPNPKLAFQWRTKLSPDQIGMIENRAGRLLQSRMYEPSGHWVPTIGPLKHKLLMLESRIRRLRGRIDEIGFDLVMMDMVARRLGLRAIAKHTMQRVNQAEQRLIDLEDAGVRSPSANIAPAAKPDA
jgi:hypothetical protein